MEQNLHPLSFSVGLKMQVSFAGFPAGISAALYNSQTHYSLLKSVVLQDTFFFPFYHSVLFLWRRKDDAVTQLIAFYLTTDLNPHFLWDIIKKKKNNKPELVL